MPLLRILLADDHPVVLDGLAVSLKSRYEIVGRVSDGRALIAAAEKLRPDLIIADISMPLLSGLEAASRIRKVDRRVKVIFLTMHMDVELATEAIRVGAAGYVSKSSAQELQAAIQEVLKGHRYVSPGIAHAVLQALVSAPTDPSRQTLTSRQREVLQLLAEGRRAKEIADILCISTKTVEYHKDRMKEALGLRTIAELTQYALKRGIIAKSFLQP